MIITPIKTAVVTAKGDLLEFLQQHLPPISDSSVLAITSKVVSILEGSVVSADISKPEVIRQEAEWFLPPSSNKYNVWLTIKNHALAASAGVDESNSKSGYVLLPKNAQQTANLVWEFVSSKFGLHRFGVIITDSRTTPLQWGVTGFALAHCGFQALKNYVGTPDLFGRLFHFSKASIVNGLAAAAVLVMGEGQECQPLALIQDVPFVQFQDRPPSPQELAGLAMTPADDLYAPLLTAVQWEPGGALKNDESDPSKFWNNPSRQ